MSNKNLIWNVICGHFKSDNAFMKITITAWAKDAFASRNHVNLRHRVASLFTPLPSILLVSASIFYPLISWDTASKDKYIYIKKKCWRPFRCDAPFPSLDFGPWSGVCVTRRKTFRRQPEGATHGKHWCCRETLGWRMIRLDALHLSLWIQALSQFYSQRETFYSPSFE